GAITTLCLALDAQTASCSGSGRSSGNGHCRFKAASTPVVNPSAKVPQRASEALRYASLLHDLFCQQSCLSAALNLEGTDTSCGERRADERPRHFRRRYPK